MARVAWAQNAWPRGVLSKRLHDRHDLQLYYGGLRSGQNYVVDSRGLLEKRPGTMFVSPTSDNAEALLIPFAYSPTQAYVLEFTHQQIRAYANYGLLYDGMDPFAEQTDYDFPEVFELSFVQNNDVMFITHGNHQQSRLIRDSASTFVFEQFDTFDGPYLNVNDNPAWLLAISTDGSDKILTASGSGFAPFTAGMVGRWVRIQTPNTDSEANAELGEDYLWDFFQITEYVSSTVVKCDAAADVSATDTWRLGAFYTGEWPSRVSYMNGRLILAKRNRVYWSRPYDFNNFAPTYHDPNGGATNRVLPDSAITGEVDSGLMQTGAISDIFWMIPRDKRLLLGTPAGLVTAQSTDGSAYLTQDTLEFVPHDGRGVSECRPIQVSDTQLFAHATGRRLQAAYDKQSAVPKIGAQNVSNPSDDLITGGIKQLAWQDYPYGIVWFCMDDGNLVSLTLEPEEEIQGFMPHKIGGSFNNGGSFEHAHVESVCTIPSPDGTKNDLWMIVKRTIDGSTKRYVEVLRPFRELGEDPRNAWYLDSALRYDGNLDEAKTLSFTIPADGPNSDWPFTTNFSSPAFEAQQKLAIFDGKRWHVGTVIELTGSNNFTWRPAAPNAPPAPADGLRWIWNPDENEWDQPEESKESYARSRTYPSYQQPAQTSGIWIWSLSADEISNLDHLEGETVESLADGTPISAIAVDGGAINIEGEAHVITAGLPFEANGELLQIMQGAQAGSAWQKQKQVYEVVISQLESGGVEAGTGLPNDHTRTWYDYEPVAEEVAFAEGEPPPLFSGTKRFGRDAQFDPSDPRVAWRSRVPLPSYVRTVLARLSTSDGR